MLKYTLCFIRHRWMDGDMILMLYRKNPPNEEKYNGVGGKLEPGELPRVGMLREIAEETQLNVTNLRFGGTVVWDISQDGSGKQGMYVYTADWDEKVTLDNLHLTQARNVDEGQLVWMPTWWCRERRPMLVDNIPYFLKPMLDGKPPHEYVCHYEEDNYLSHVSCNQLPQDVIDLATREVDAHVTTTTTR